LSARVPTRYVPSGARLPPPALSPGISPVSRTTFPVASSARIRSLPLFT
jgi:hypothetical protein